jgi:H+/gluconate symporter-like permease
MSFKETAASTMLKKYFDDPKVLLLSKKINLKIEQQYQKYSSNLLLIKHRN